MTNAKDKKSSRKIAVKGKSEKKIRGERNNWNRLSRKNRNKNAREKGKRESKREKKRKIEENKREQQ